MFVFGCLPWNLESQWDAGKVLQVGDFQFIFIFMHFALIFMLFTVGGAETRNQTIAKS